MLTIYLVITAIIAVLLLFSAGAAKMDGDDEPAAIALIGVLLSGLWPVLLPLLILFGLWCMVIFVIKTLTDVTKPKWMPEFLWRED